MKPMQFAFAAALVTLIAGCGGGGGGGGDSGGNSPPPSGGTPPAAGQYKLGGTVSGLPQGTTVALANGSETINASGPFTFATPLAAGAAFNISATPPGGYTCKVTDGTGTMGSADSTKTAVACAPVLVAGAVTALQEPHGVTSDSAGNLYVLDGGPHAVVKVPLSGPATPLAGGSGKPGLVDGTGAAARFRFGFAGDVVVDPSGNLLVSDDCNGAIRKITPQGVVTTLAGSGATVCNNVNPALVAGVDGTGSAATFERPQRMVGDGDGVIVLDSARRLEVRRVSATGVVTTQTWQTPAGLEGAQKFYAMARTSDGTLYFSDFAGRIWKDAGSNTLALVAGGLAGFGAQDGTGAGARFLAITDMVAGPDGNLYVGDQSMVRKVTPDGQVSTLAGTPVRGSADGVGQGAGFSSIRSIGVYNKDNLVVVDNDQGTLRTVSLANGTVTTLRATDPVRGLADGTGIAARFNSHNSLAADASGALFTVDSIMHVVRKVSADGKVETIAGKLNTPGTGDGALATATFREPGAVAAGRDGSLWIAQSVGLRRIMSGNVSTVAPLLQAVSVAVEADGNAIVATATANTTASGTVQRVTSAGNMQELVNKAKVEALIGATGIRFVPQSVVIDGAGNIYISDTGTVAVYKLDKAGVLTVFAGSPQKEGDADGAVNTAKLGFYEVEYMTIDDKGNLYLSGQGGVRMISPAGVVSSPTFDWANASVGAIAYANGKLYGMTRYALLQTYLK